MTRLAILFALSACLNIHAQDDYWQQEVHYNIAVSLDDENHKLKATWELEYQNNSPETLDFIYLHVWPNAYSSKESKLAKQIYQEGNDYIHFGPDSIKGYLKVEGDITQDGQAAEYSYHAIDIIKLELNQPLPPNQSTTLAMNYEVGIPSGRISRLGHLGQSYQITQWYPKPAVFDQDGWHEMSYLNQGEFYSEYGSFDVSITLPKNYVLGATGDLQNSDEEAWLKQKEEETKQWFEKGFDVDSLMKFPPSDTETKTLRFIQSNVHDFAWFCDKRYFVLTGEVEMPHSDRTVKSVALFTPRNARQWENSIEYLNDGTYYYSLWNGDYPYNHVTAVDGTISAGGGMEYPNITVIGNMGSKRQLEIVIVHEVGHNWFYGVLGSNERTHGWMDEGLNTLNEVRYIQTKYPDNESLSDAIGGGFMHMDHLDYQDQSYLSAHSVMRVGEDQPCETTSEGFTSLNYGLIMYQKTGLIFNYLRDYLGDERFDQAMSTYYDEWKFKHPQPEDLRRSLEQSTGEDLSWMFDGLINSSAHVDYRINKVKVDQGKTYVTVRDAGQVSGPISVGIKVDSVWYIQWVNPEDKRPVILEFEGEAHTVQIDPHQQIPEINRTNNYWQRKGIVGIWEPFSAEFLTGDHEIEKTNIFFLPAYGTNFGDRHMFGLAIHNYGAFAPPLAFHLVPMYSLERGKLSGLANVHYSMFPDGGVSLIKTGIEYRSFKLFPALGSLGGLYWAASPYVQMKFRPRASKSPWSGDQVFKGQYREETLIDRTFQHLYGAQSRTRVEYRTRDFRWLNSIITEGMTSPEYELSFLRSRVSTEFHYRYLKKNQAAWVELRLFGGNYWAYQSNNLSFDPLAAEEQRYYMSMSGANGAQDLFFEEMSFNRYGGMNQNQALRMNNMGGMKNVSSYGTTNEWMAASNLYIQLPFSGLGIFADYGVFSRNNMLIPTYDAGVALRVGKFAGIYVPLVFDENLKTALTGVNFVNRIRFTLQINLFDKPFNLREWI